MKEFKEGQKAFHVTHGEVEITEIVNERNYPIVTEVDAFMECGRSYIRNKHPSLFHSKEEMIEYFQNVKTKKTFVRWVNLYGSGNIGGFCNTEKEADEHAKIARVECRKIEWTVEI